MIKWSHIKRRNHVRSDSMSLFYPGLQTGSEPNRTAFSINELNPESNRYLTENFRTEPKTAFQLKIIKERLKVGRDRLFDTLHQFPYFVELPKKNKRFMVKITPNIIVFECVLWFNLKLKGTNI